MINSNYKLIVTLIKEPVEQNLTGLRLIFLHYLLS